MNTERGKQRYEADVKARPIYPDGSSRKTWEQLEDFAKAQWIKAPLPHKNSSKTSL